MVLSSTFWHIYAIACSQIFYGYFIIGSFKDYGNKYGEGQYDDAFLSFMGAIGALFNGVFRIFWSSLLDKYPFHNVYGTLCGIQCFLIIFISWAVQYKWPFFIFISLSFMCEGAICSILPTITLMKFGHKRGHDVFAYMFSSYGVSSMGGAVIVNQLIYIIYYRGLFIISFILTLVAIVLMLRFRADIKFDYKTICRPEDKKVDGEIN
jgi:MFS family permease